MQGARLISKCPHHDYLVFTMYHHSHIQRDLRLTDACYSCVSITTYAVDQFILFAILSSSREGVSFNDLATDVQTGLVTTVVSLGQHEVAVTYPRS